MNEYRTGICHVAPSADDIPTPETEAIWDPTNPEKMYGFMVSLVCIIFCIAFLIFTITNNLFMASIFELLTIILLALDRHRLMKANRKTQP